MRSCMNCQHRMNNCTEWGEHPECTRYLRQVPKEHKAPHKGGRYKENEYGGKYNATVPTVMSKSKRSRPNDQIRFRSDRSSNAEYDGGNVLPSLYKLVREDQTLYYFDETTEQIASGNVVQKEETFFTFNYQNKTERLPYEVIGSRLFLHRLGPKKIQEEYLQEKQARIAKQRREAAIKAEIEAQEREAERRREEKRAAEQEEKQRIKAYLEDREAYFFVHFTPISNLPSILKHGILPRSELNKRNIHADTPDSDRLDNRLDYSSFSIAFPNYSLFYYKRRNTPFQYAVLIIDLQIILDLPLSAISYLPNNAASNLVNRVDNYTGFEALKALYAPTVQIGTASYSRGQLGIPDRYPTNPQSEVFIRSAIAPEYITSIKGENATQVTQIKELLFREGVQSPLLSNNKINYNYIFFRPRVDHFYWKEELKPSTEES